MEEAGFNRRREDMKRVLRVALGIFLVGLIVPCAAGADGEPIIASPAVPLTFDTVTFTPASTAGVTSFGWDLDNDGFFDDAATESASRSFPTAGTYTVRLRVNGVNWSSVYSLFLTVADRPPSSSMAYFPGAPEAEQPVSFVSTSQDPDGTLASQSWDLNGDGVFDDATGPVATYTFPHAGVYTVRLRVVDNDGSEAVGSQLVNVAAKPLAFLSPFPLVRVSGSLTARGVRIARLVVQAPPGARVEVRCRGHGCRRHREIRVVTPRPGLGPHSFRLLRFRGFERALDAHAVLQISVTNPPMIGKYTRFTIRKGLQPRRRDLCILPGAKRPSRCTS